MSFILGTAGHIDHGKTSLIRALTGINCDRLDEEKKRGITIELGFAWLDLPDGQRLGIVDVPGHERFVKNMVAGAAGIDLVMLVIAADEGVMPQTREHLDICSLLGIRQGFVVLNKCDLVDEDWLHLVTEDVANFLQDTFLEGCPILPASAVSGQGLEEVRATIASMVHNLPGQNRTDLFRLPVDRIFSLRGFGTIVTGTIISGRIERDRDAVIMPRGLATHVRTLQRHEEPTEEARAGERCAANLQGLDVADIHRGDVLALPGTLFPSDRWIVHLDCLKSSPMPLRNRTELHFHHGTLESLARVVFFDRQELKPGESALAELRFATPAVAVAGDRCVLRASSPLRAVAGGSIVSPLPPLLRAKDPGRAEKLQLLGRLCDLLQRQSPEETAERVETILALRDREGASHSLLHVLSGLTRRHLDRALQQLSSKHRALCFDREGNAWIGAQAFDRLCEACLARAKELHDKSPLQSGFARTALESGWSQGLAPKLVTRVLESMLAQGRLLASGEFLKLPGHNIVLSPAQQKICQALRSLYAESGLTPPNLRDALDRVHATEKEAQSIYKLLVAQGELVKMRDGIFYAREHFDTVVGKVRQWFETHDDLTLADLKTLLGLSRKYLIALLEYLDQEKITVRIGDKRQFRSH